jgi:hypothetical protein
MSKWVNLILAIGIFAGLICAMYAGFNEDYIKATFYQTTAIMNWLVLKEYES